MISKIKKVLSKSRHEGNSHLNFYARVNRHGWLNTQTTGRC